MFSRSAERGPASARPAVRRRLHWRHRRTLRWALACALVVAAAVSFLSRGAGDVIVFTATSDLPTGHHLTEDDVAGIRFPADLVPDGAVSEVAEVLDGGLTGPVRRGEMLTDARATRSPGGAAQDRTRVVPVPVAEAGLATHMRAGSVVDVIVAGPPETGSAPDVLAHDAVIVDVAAAPVGGGMTLLLRLPEEAATYVAARALDTPVTVTMHG